VGTILIGVDDSPRSQDAVTFAAPLAVAADADIVLVSALADGDAGAALQRRMAERAHGVAPERIRTVTVAHVSPAHALHELAASDGAALIVVGSTHTTHHVGRVIPGSTAERLLHGAPCAVAVAPQGYRTQVDRPLRRIGVAFDGSPESRAALDAAAAVAATFGARLRVMRVLEDAAAVADTRRVVRAAREALEEAIVGLPADAVLLAGDPALGLADESRRLDLLVAGSRGYGPLSAVLLGGVTGRLAREAACPLVIVPRGVHAPFAELFAGARVA
jgi:nucleotide-binding universal stress UspA family protein